MISIKFHENELLRKKSKDAKTLSNWWLTNFSRQISNLEISTFFSKSRKRIISPLCKQLRRINQTVFGIEKNKQKHYIKWHWTENNLRGRKKNCLRNASVHISNSAIYRTFFLNYAFNLRVVFYRLEESQIKQEV